MKIEEQRDSIQANHTFADAKVALLRFQQSLKIRAERKLPLKTAKKISTRYLLDLQSKPFQHNEPSDEIDDTSFHEFQEVSHIIIDTLHASLDKALGETVLQSFDSIDRNILTIEEVLAADLSQLIINVNKLPELRQYKLTQETFLAIIISMLNQIQYSSRVISGKQMTYRFNINLYKLERILRKLFNPNTEVKKAEVTANPTPSELNIKDNDFLASLKQSGVSDLLIRGIEQYSCNSNLIELLSETLPILKYKNGISQADLNEFASTLYAIMQKYDRKYGEEDWWYIVDFLNRISEHYGIKLDESTLKNLNLLLNQKAQENGHINNRELKLPLEIAKEG